MCAMAAADDSLKTPSEGEGRTCTDLVPLKGPEGPPQVLGPGDLKRRPRRRRS